MPEISTDLLLIALAASVKAGNAIMDVYGNDFDVDIKADKSPITEADRQAHSIIAGCLANTQLPQLSEEGKDISYDARKNWELYWLVDPLDGTKEFVSRNGEFTVNIALINKDSPVLGVVFIPVQDELYFASDTIGSYKLNGTSSIGLGSSIETIVNQSTKLPLLQMNDHFVVVASRSHMNQETSAYIKKIEADHKHTSIISVGSSLKFCAVAEGRADVYPRFGPTMEWDTAAGHAILKYAGGAVIQVGNNQELNYNKPDLKNPFFIASRSRIN